MSYQFSFSHNLFEKQLSKIIDVKDLYNYIVNDDELKTKTALVLKSKEQGNYSQQKKQLPVVIPAGIFEERNKNGLQKISGLICLDLDHVEDIMSVREELISHSFTNLLFISPSGAGLKLFIKIEVDYVEEYSRWFIAIQRYFSEELALEIDKACKDISRACFIPHDENAYLNLDSEVLKKDFLNEWNPIEDGLTSKRVSQDLRKNNIEITEIELSEEQKLGFRKRIISIAQSKIRSANDGEKHNVLLSSSNYLGYHIPYGIIDYKTAFDVLFSAISKRKIEDTKAAERTICDGLNYGVENRPSFEELGLHNALNFWYIEENDKGDASLSISYTKSFRFLNDHGFWLYRKDDTYLLVRVTDNIITKIDKYEVIQFMLDFIKEQPWKIHNKVTRDELEELFRKKINVIFSDKQLHTFNTLTPRFVRDTDDTTRLFFKNGFLEITSDYYNLKAYKELNGHIWNTQILDRDFTDLKLSNDVVFEQSEFSKFIIGISGNATSKNTIRLDSMKSIIGYLLSSYKDPKLSKAIIFCDEKISDVPSGGTGKGITLKAISKFKNVAIIDGKNLNFRSQFVYQQVELDTDVMIFEDVKRTFDFEKLFSVITEGCGVEKKNKDKFFIPYEESPKIVITTNYVVEGEGNSHNRRRIEYEFSQHYNKEHTPFKEFGKNLYDDWDENQWQLFNHYIIHCIQFFLSNGLISPPKINIGFRKLMQNTNEEFAVYINEIVNNLIDYESEKSVLKNNFLEEYPDYKRYHWFSQRHFNKWLRTFADCYGFRVLERISNNKQLIRFEKIDK